MLTEEADGLKFKLADGVDIADKWYDILYRRFLQT